MEKSILLHCISPEELKQIIKEAVKQELSEIKNQLQEKDAEVLLTREETSKFLKISLTTLWHWTKNGRVIGYGIGNRVYYKKKELVESLVKFY